MFVVAKSINSGQDTGHDWSKTVRMGVTRHATTWLIAFATVCSVMVLSAGPNFQTAAQELGRVSSLPIPRFVSLRTDPVNLRTGPGTRYPITWVYQRRLLPVEVVDEFDTWRRIRDPDGEEGWVHQSMLSGERTGLVSGDVSPVYKGSTTASTIVAQISPGVVIRVERCPEQIEFCLIEADGIEGWLRRGLFWGLYDGETID